MAAIELGKKPMLDRDVFLRSTSTEAEDSGEEGRVEVSLFELIEAFRKILERVKEEEFHEVILDRLSVEEKVQEILSLLQRDKRSMAFHLLFPKEGRWDEVFGRQRSMTNFSIRRYFGPRLLLMAKSV
jgi:segregation and condensation protein A